MFASNRHSPTIPSTSLFNLAQTYECMTRYPATHTSPLLHLWGNEICPSGHTGDSCIFVCHTARILSASQECAQQRWAAQMVVLTAGERTSNKAGRCQLGSGCLKHQFLAAGYKVILDGFITDSLCQSVSGFLIICNT